MRGNILSIVLVAACLTAGADVEPQYASPFGFHPARVSKLDYEDSGYVDATNIGVRWTRAALGTYWFLVQTNLNEETYDFASCDQKCGEIPPSICILGNIAPQTGIDEGRCLPGSWVPVDIAKYQAFVRSTVERYDGDGIDDMPGLTNPIRYWQVGNEHNMNARTNAATLHKITYLAIKDACPDCQVLLGGVGGFTDGYVSKFDEGYTPILAALAGSYVDVFDFHWYGTCKGQYRLVDTATDEDVLAHIRAALSNYGFSPSLPIWITEMGSYSGWPKAGDLESQTEREQAADYFKRFIYPLSRGVKKIFPAYGLIEGFRYNDGYFDHTGMIYDGTGSGDLGLGVKKLAYFTYKKMTKMLADADWSSLTNEHDGSDTDQLYCFRLNVGNEETHIAWWDTFDVPEYSTGDMTNISISVPTGTVAVVVTSALPRGELGRDIGSEAFAFPRRYVVATNNAATVPVGATPVYIELDTDGDGMTDGEEAVAGTSPTDSSAYLAFTELNVDSSSATAVLHWLSATGRVYGVQRSFNLADGFSNLAVNLPATPPQNTCTDATWQADHQVFYMLDVQVQP